MPEIEAPGTIRVSIPDEVFNKVKKPEEEEEKKAAQPPTLDMVVARMDQLTSKVSELAEALKARREEEKYPCPEAKAEKPEKYPYKEEKAEKPKDKEEDEEEKKAVKPKEEEDEEKKAEFDWEAVDLNAYETLKGKLPSGLRRWIEEHRKKKAEEKKPEKYPYKEEEKSESEDFTAGDMIQRAIDTAIAKRLGEQPVVKRSTVAQKTQAFETPMDIPQEIFAVADLPSLFKMGGYKVRGVTE